MRNLWHTYRQKSLHLARGNLSGRRDEEDPRQAHIGTQGSGNGTVSSGQAHVSVTDKRAEGRSRGGQPRANALDGGDEGVLVQGRHRIAKAAGGKPRRRRGDSS